MKFFLTILVAFCVNPILSDILYFSVSGNATVDGSGSVYSFLAPMPYDGYPDYNTVYGARVAVKNSSGDVLRYLDVYYQTNPEETNPMYFDYKTEPGMVETDIGHPNEGFVGADWVFADVGRDLLSEALFQIELGRSVFVGDDYEWTAIAYSDNVTGKWLEERDHTYETFDLNPPTATPWSPQAYYTISPQGVVPEPSSWMLAVLGFGILALRRRR